MTYKAILYSPTLKSPAILSDYSYLRYTRVVNDIGTFTIELPYDVKVDYLSMVEIYRGDVLETNTKWFVTRKSINVSENTTVLEGVCLNYLLSTRIVNYFAGSSQAAKNTYPTSMLREVVEENLGDLAGTGRVLDISLPAAVSYGTTINLSFARKNVLTVLQDICNTAASNNEYVYFDMQWRGKPTFLIFIDKVGKALTTLYGNKHGNVEQLDVVFDWDTNVTKCVVGGQDKGANRTVVTASSEVFYASPYAVNEVFLNYTSSSNSSRLLLEGKKFINSHKAKVTLKARIRDTENNKYGVHWGFGDAITIEYNDRLYSGMIKAVQVRIDRNSNDIDSYVTVSEDI